VQGVHLTYITFASLLNTRDVVGKKVIVDTNALLIPGEFGVDIFAELERLGYVHVIVPRAVLKELDRLRGSPGATGKERRAAAMGYSLLEQFIRTSDQSSAALALGCRVSIAEPENGAGADAGAGEAEDTDALILRLAVRQKAAVLTNDEELRWKLSRAGTVTIYLRAGTRLEERE
jgi:rRNA-processing protein FCF1